ncbi:skin secretory protein xP2-like [Corvus kubaryi]|uniref:skin secretory protein xP2-like n=1 Tax=Corvus kubaryi TaxID=68294 RepID=UPI001C05B615|nr:skin secretory protein xP2-like [Corvus kubaryi]XP_041881379.1 skin secretory protein xP2-like [Corvus kubaryi]
MSLQDALSQFKSWTARHLSPHRLPLPPPCYSRPSSHPSRVLSRDLPTAPPWLQLGEVGGVVAAAAPAPAVLQAAAVPAVPPWTSATPPAAPAHAALQPGLALPAASQPAAPQTAVSAAAVLWTSAALPAELQPAALQTATAPAVAPWPGPMPAAAPRAAPVPEARQPNPVPVPAVQQPAVLAPQGPAVPLRSAGVAPSSPVATLPVPPGPSPGPVALVYQAHASTAGQLLVQPQTPQPLGKDALMQQLMVVLREAMQQFAALPELVRQAAVGGRAPTSAQPTPAEAPSVAPAQMTAPAGTAMPPQVAAFQAVPPRVYIAALHAAACGPRRSSPRRRRTARWPGACVLSASREIGHTSV